MEDANSATPGTPVNGSGTAIRAIPAFRIAPLREGGLVTSLTCLLRDEVSMVLVTLAFSLATLATESAEERTSFEGGC